MLASACGGAGATDRAVVYEEFCLRGEFDLGARLQGHTPSSGEWHPASWCVVASPESEQVHFVVTGRSNPDIEGTFALSYLSPDRVRLVNAEAPPDVEFRGTVAGDEAAAVRRIDPLRLMEELDRHPEWVVEDHGNGWRDVRWPGAPVLAQVQVLAGRLRAVRTWAELPLRGRVPVTWEWTWGSDGVGADLALMMDRDTIFRASGSRRALTPPESDSVWSPSGGRPPLEAPGRAWPAMVRMDTETLDAGVHIVRGVRTGFHHLVVETAEGLVVADAPAGWVELHQIPPAELVPGFGGSGLSERFIDYLRSQWPGVPLRAVVLTHAHDDHAGGARAFAAAGADVYAPGAVADFIERALNRVDLPEDRLAMTGRSVRVQGVAERLVLDDPVRPVELIPLGSNPHVDAALGVYVPAASVFFQSDLHVPASEASAPRAERAETECWFAEWADRSLPSETRVHNSHGLVGLPVARIAMYLNDDACRGPGP